MQILLRSHAGALDVVDGKLQEPLPQFFQFRPNPQDDMAAQVSSLKTVWNSLKEALSGNDNTVSLPEMFFVCKLFDVLPEQYDSFKSNWVMFPKESRTIEQLTTQLCAHEKIIQARETQRAANNEVLAAQTHARNAAKDTSYNAANRSKVNKEIVCHYCNKKGHMVRECKKWMADGRPPKGANKSAQSVATSRNSAEAKPRAMTVIETNTFTTGLGGSTQVDNAWYVDNGATNHITNDRSAFSTFEPFGDGYSVTTAKGEQAKALGRGTINLDALINGKTRSVQFTNVWYVPDVQKNLWSVLAAQDKIPKSKFTSKTETCELREGNGSTLVFGTRSKGGGLYKLAVRVKKPQHPSQVNTVTGSSTLQLMHERMGHQNKRHVVKVADREFGLKLPLDSELCEGCVFGKAHRLPFGSRDSYRATAPGEIIHTDVCGPFQPSAGKKEYFVLFKDDYTRFRTVYFIKHKNEVPEKMKQYLNQVKTSGHTVKQLRCDGGGEFDNACVKRILSQRGIKQMITMPYTPQQNGAAERENRTIVEAARSMFHSHGKLPQILWAEMLHTAGYILNRTGTSSVEGKSPFELWYGRKPAIGHLRVIGTTAYAKIPDQRRKSKMDKKAIKCVLVGYDENDGYRLFNLATNQLIRSRDVVFQEEPFSQSKKLDGMLINVDTLKSADQPSKEIDQCDQEDQDSTDDEGSTAEEADEAIDQLRKLRDRSKLQKPIKLRTDYVMSVAATISNQVCEPESYDEACNSPDKAKWVESMDSEISSLAENHTWTLVKLPAGRKAIANKWVYKVKMNPDGTVDKYKSRLVIKGFNQRHGIDYGQTFSPVAKSGTIRSVIAVAASERMSMMQFDVSTAFLYGELEEEVYMQQPEGYDDGSGRVCRLNRSLYGLKQAPRCWNKRFGSFLINLGFKRSDADPCLFIRVRDQRKLLVALYVDDGLVAATSKSDADQFLRELKKEFKITAKPSAYFLGIEIEQQKDGSVKISQRAYTKRILERFNMASCNPVNTPIIKDGTIAKPDETESAEVSDYPYRAAVGALMYLMCGTRPDIAYAIGVVSRNLEKPTPEDVNRVKRIFRYLKGTSEVGIVYKPGANQGVLRCYSDADHGGDSKTGRSTSGVACIYAGGAISWLSQLQSSVATSTTEAEVVAASEAAREAVWLNRLLSEIGVLTSVPILYCDNEAAVRLAQNPEYHRRTKHIRLRHFFVREKVTEGEINIERISTDRQVADMLTKPLHAPMFEKFNKELGLATNKQ